MRTISNKMGANFKDVKLVPHTLYDISYILITYSLYEIRGKIFGDVQKLTHNINFDME